MRSPCYCVVCPLLGNGSANTFSHQQIHTNNIIKAVGRCAFYAVRVVSATHYVVKASPTRVFDAKTYCQS
jgi:hypothetical protein